MYTLAKRQCKIFRDSLMFCNGSCSGTNIDRLSRWPMTIGLDRRSTTEKNDRYAITKSRREQGKAGEVFSTNLFSKLVQLSQNFQHFDGNVVLLVEWTHSEKVHSELFQQFLSSLYPEEWNTRHFWSSQVYLSWKYGESKTCWNKTCSLETFNLYAEVVTDLLRIHVFRK